MRLSVDDAQLFFRLHRSLMIFVNQRLHVIDDKVATPDAYSELPPTTRFEVQKAFLKHLALIDAFAAENPFGLDENDLEIVRSWKHLVAGNFYAFRQLQNHMVFLATTKPVAAYGIVYLFDPFEILIGTNLPRMVETTLLPFKGRIIYDGILGAYNITFGSGIRCHLNASYKEAKEQYGIVTSLPMQPGAPTPARKKTTTRTRTTTSRTTGSKSTTSTVQAAHDRIVALTDAFCQEHLNAEYAALCRKLAGVLSRKRPSPLLGGRSDSWASGIVRVIGWANFLGDPSQPHYMKMTDIDEGIGVSPATGSAKAKAIHDLLKIRRFDPEWTLPSRMDKNPLARLIQLKGLLADALHLPREIQKESHRKGLIPYVPDDPTDSADD